jgi:hypothetical protein
LPPTGRRYPHPAYIKPPGCVQDLIGWVEVRESRIPP